MTDFVLYLLLDNLGIKAMIVKQDYKNNSIQDDCHILFKDLPNLEPDLKSDIKSDIKTGHDFFDTVMDIAASRLDLKTCSTAIIFVSSVFVCFRNIDMPFSSKKKIKQILSFELEPLLPFVNETYISDFHMLDILSESNLILSASIAESLVEKYFLKLDSFGIKPLIITPFEYSAAIAFLREHENISTFGFLHFSDSDNTFVLVHNKKPCIVRTFSSRSYEDIAISVKQTIIGFNQRTGLDISFDIFISSDENDFKSEDIYNTLEKVLGYRSELNPTIDSNALLTSISPHKPIKHMLNFCKGKYGTSSFLKRYFGNIAAAIALFLCVFALLMINVSFDNSKLNKKISAIDAKALLIFNKTFPGKKNIKDPYLQMKANAQKAIKKTANGKPLSTKTKDIKAIEILRELSNKIPSSIDVDTSRFLFNNGQLILSGATDNFNNVDKIKGSIESSDLFEKVRISSATADKHDNRINFKFIIEM